MNPTKKKIKDAISGEKEKQTKVNLTDFGKKKSTRGTSNNSTDSISDLVHAETRGK